MDKTWDDRWPDSLLDQLRHQGDPLADAAVVELSRKLGRPAAAHTVDLVAVLNERAQAGPGACRDLLAQVNAVPAWVSFPSMRIGYEVGLAYPVASGLSLLCGSLAESYSGGLGAKVLVRTGNLARSTRRRVYETADFLHVLALSNGPRPGTAGHQALIQLRLIHAYIRAAMQRRGDWDMRWGLPVNQEDYGATLLVFSFVFVRSMQRLGVKVSDAELDSIHHGWRYAGYVMGIDDRLLTESREAEAALYAKISHRQQHPDADSQALTAALFSEMAWQPPFMFPPQALHAICRRLIGQKLADAMKVPRTALWQSLPVALRTLGQAQSMLCGAVPGSTDVARRLGTRFIGAVLDYALAQSRGPGLGQQAGLSPSGTPSPEEARHSGGH